MDAHQWEESNKRATKRPMAGFWCHGTCKTRGYLLLSSLMTHGTTMSSSIHQTQCKKGLPISYTRQCLSLRTQNSSISRWRSVSLYGLVMKPSIPVVVALEIASSVTSALTANTVGTRNEGR